LHEQLKRTDRVVISAVSGMGGIGKTELAIQYASRYLNDYPGGVCWLKARETNLSSQILDYALFNLNLEVPQELGGEPLSILRKAQWCLQHWQPFGEALLILDDITNISNFREILQGLPKRFRVLLTTRQQNLDVSFYELTLDVLSVKSSVELLVAIVGYDRVVKESKAAEEICKLVGYLPLGIELIGRYLAEDVDLSFSEMLKRLDVQRLRDESLDLDDQQAQEKYIMTAHRGIRVAFDLTWKELESFTMNVALIIGILGLDIVPWVLIDFSAKSLNWSENDVIKAKKQLYKCSLVQRIDERSCKVHPLIRDFLQLKLVNFNQPAELKRLGAKSLNDLANLYCTQINYSEAEKLCIQALRIRRELFGTDNFDTAASLNTLAGIYYEQGRYEEAEPLAEQALEVHQRLLEETHSDLVISLNNLGVIYCARRRHSDAELLLQKALSIRQSAILLDSLSLANSYNNLAILGQDNSSKWGDKLDLIEYFYEQSLNLIFSVFGEENTLIASTFSDLASFYFEQSRYEDAENYYLKALEIRISTLGNDHSDTAASFEDLAVFYDEKGLLEKGINFHIQAFDIYKKNLGLNHTTTASVRMNIEKFLLAVRSLVIEGGICLAEDHITFLDELWLKILDRGSFTDYLENNLKFENSECVQQVIESRNGEWCNLSFANFSNQDLSGVSLRNAILFCANFSGARLVNANLNDADLIGANLDNVYIKDTDLSRSNLSFASIKEGSIEHTDLRDSELISTVIHNCSLNFVNLLGFRLRGQLSKSKLNHCNLTFSKLGTIGLKRRKGVYEFIGLWTK